eukprot:CAMPEP_0114149270 /NCGR_PEP_ID=MMETSP0043_2-20121206/22070_1 /TAXON_ID=464988 /ORGANISM="Hemiselmis andersenii, Strain CCMP644" /LENGTH=77 /DNA_ID=CAMNT_0001243903 /DNA_START=125 /DNA_END=358 /DNA_ORIENTATION=+
MSAIVLLLDAQGMTGSSSGSPGASRSALGGDIALDAGDSPCDEGGEAPWRPCEGGEYGAASQWCEDDDGASLGEEGE